MRAAVLLVLLAACDDTIFGSGGGGGSDSGGYPEGYEGVVAIFEDNCVSCHPAGGGSGGLDLASDPCSTLVGRPATYDGDLVAAGDHSASVLWHKMADTGEFGGVMPLGGALDQATVDIVAQWIDDGASCL